MTPAPLIDRFVGEYRFLSNFYLRDIMYEGIKYASTEHAYQSAKTLISAERHHINWSDLHNRPTTPGEAKRAGGKKAKYPITLRADWDHVKIEVMYDMLKIKFAYPDLLQKLLATACCELIEGNNYNDRFWGVCRGTGNNWLGILLMQVRGELGLIT